MRVRGVEHLHWRRGAHVPQPHQAVPGRAADEGHVVVGAEAVDGLVEGLLPPPHEGPAPRVEQTRRGVVPVVLGRELRVVNRNSSKGFDSLS